jgi:hypothetical protein
MTTIARRFQQRFHFLAAQNQWQLSFPPGKRNAIDADFPAECVGIEKPQCADSLDISGLRHSFLFDEEQLVAANVLSTKLIRWFTEMPSELGDDMQVNADGGGRVMTNLEILQHPLSKWGHKKSSFRCDHTTNNARPAGGLVQYVLTRRLRQKRQQNDDGTLFADHSIVLCIHQ